MMDARKTPVRTTIQFGLLCGLAFIPLKILFAYSTLWPFLFRLFIFAVFCAYALLLTNWGDRRRTAVLFPAFLLFLFLFSPGSGAAFMLLALGLLSWVRSGICFENGHARSLAAELALCIGGGALVAWFSPHSAIAWGLGIWVFFMVQSLYFPFMGPAEETAEGMQADPFEQARMRAEAIVGPIMH